MPKEEMLVVEGIVKEVVSGNDFLVALLNEDGTTGRDVHAFLSGKVKKNFIRVLPGDRVKMEMSMYDLTKGRIVYRQTNQSSPRNA